MSEQKSGIEAACNAINRFVREIAILRPENKQLKEQVSELTLKLTKSYNERIDVEKREQVLLKALGQASYHLSFNTYHAAIKTEEIVNKALAGEVVK